MRGLPLDDDDLLPAGPISARTAALHASVAAIAGQPCTRCGKPLCGHEAVLAILLGSRHAPRCATCAAAEHGESRAELGERSLQWILRRDCFLQAWRHASEAEGHGTVDRPACTFHAAGDAAPDAERTPAAAKHGDPTPAVAEAMPPSADTRLDAGDLGCGDLVIELKFKFADLPPGTVLEVRATDPAAYIDLPAWCGLVGHTLLHASPPHFWIRRRNHP